MTLTDGYSSTLPIPSASRDKSHTSKLLKKINLSKSQLTPNPQDHNITSSQLVSA